MRRILFALALLSLSVVDAVGQSAQCLVAESGTIAKAISAIQRGEINGQFVEGAAATKMAREFGFKDAAAVFLINGDDGNKLAIVAIRHDGRDLACFVNAAKAVKLFGQKA